MGVNYNNWKNNMLLQCLLSFYLIINEWYSLTVEYHYNIDIVLTYMYLPTCTFNVLIVLFIPLTHKLLHCKHFCLFWTRTLWIFQTEDLETCHRQTLIDHDQSHLPECILQNCTTGDFIHDCFFVVLDFFLENFYDT